MTRGGRLPPHAPLTGSDRPEWFSAIASGDIMKMKIMARQNKLDLTEVSGFVRGFAEKTTF